MEWRQLNSPTRHHEGQLNSPTRPRKRHHLLLISSVHPSSSLSPITSPQSFTGTSQQQATFSPELPHRCPPPRTLPQRSPHHPPLSFTATVCRHLYCLSPITSPQSFTATSQQQATFSPELPHRCPPPDPLPSLTIHHITLPRLSLSRFIVPT